MNWQQLLTNEAVSNYIVFGAGLVVGLLIWATRTWMLPKPKSKVRVEKVDEASLIDVAPEARSRVVITYNGRPIDTFHQATFFISNRGDEVIDDIELGIRIDEAAEILDKVLEDPMGERREANASISNTNSNLQITIPFLNPDRPYKDRVVLKVYSPYALSVANLTGGGRGWTVEYADRVAYNKTMANLVGETPTTAWEFLVAAGRVLAESARLALTRW